MRSAFFYRKLQYFVTMANKVIFYSLVVGLSFIMQKLINLASGGDSSKFWSYVTFACLYAFVAAVLQAVDLFLSKFYLNGIIKSLREKYFVHILHQSASQTAHIDSGTPLSVLTNDINILENNFLLPCLDLPADFVRIVLSLVSLFLLSWQSALVTVLLTVLMGVVPLCSSFAIVKSQSIVAEKLSLFTRTAKDYLQSLSIIKTCSAKKMVNQNYQNANNQVRDAANKYNIYFNLPAASTIILVNMMYALMYVVGGAKVVKGQLDVGAIVALSLLVNQFSTPVVNAADKLMRIVGTKEVVAKFRVSSREDEKKPVLKGEFHDKIQLKHIFISYPNQESILNDITISIHKNEKVLLLGPSGSGKSTLLKAIAKLVDIKSGTILLDGHSYLQISEKDLYSVVSYCPQKGVVFNDSFRMNLDLGMGGSNEELLRMVSLAQLNDFYSGLPDGFDSKMDEEVNQISGGEKARVNLARVLFLDKPILLIDEVVSSLDYEASAKLEEMLLSLKNKTIVNVSHKIHPQLIKKYDKIILLSQGRVIAQGNYLRLKGMLKDNYEIEDGNV